MADLYAIFGVDPSVTARRLKERYRFLCHAFHPDKFPTPEQKAEAAESFKAIADAFQTLSNPRLRSEYDRDDRHDRTSAATAHGAAAGYAGAYPHSTPPSYSYSYSAKAYRANDASRSEDEDPFWLSKTAVVLVCAIIIGAVTLWIVLSDLLAGRYSWHLTKPASTVAHAAPAHTGTIAAEKNFDPAAAAESIKEYTAVEIAARQKALLLYPVLGVPTSTFNRAFVAQYWERKATTPHYFDSPEWPLTLASELASRFPMPPAAPNPDAPLRGLASRSN